ADRTQRPAAGILLLAGTGCSTRFGLPEPASEQGSDIVDLWRVLFLVAMAIGLLVIGLIAWSVVRYRRQAQTQGDGEPPQFRDNVRLELFYTAVPLVIVAVLFGLTVATQRRTTHTEERPDVRVDVTGFQWGWRFHYPEAGVTVVGDSNHPPTLVLPAGRRVGFALASTDVIHSFYVPAFLDKRDVVPGEENRVDVTTTRVGRFSGLCAEFCGLDHARMAFTVDVVPPAEFQAWLAAQQEGRTRPPVPGTAQ
ncbi:MAG TPA: cytochrome c oxidase subunit II, partial [Acidimicrobiales bacterium]|nr:cytochrome c oxidase subunit II [Acidimicrobiales bacterium]